MREILFRGKCLHNDVWIYGSLIHIGKYCCILEPDCENYGVTYLDSKLGTIDGTATPVDPTTVGQFINEWDRNGQKLFEGDIVNVYGKYFDPEDKTLYEALIVADNSCLINLDGLGRHRPQDTVRVEIIGNIYDNPELLSDKAKRWLDNYYFPDYEGEPFWKWS